MKASVASVAVAFVLFLLAPTLAGADAEPFPPMFCNDPDEILFGVVDRRVCIFGGGESVGATFSAVDESEPLVVVWGFNSSFQKSSSPIAAFQKDGNWVTTRTEFPIENKPDGVRFHMTLPDGSKFVIFVPRRPEVQYHPPQ